MSGDEVTTVVMGLVFLYMRTLVYCKLHVHKIAGGRKIIECVVSEADAITDLRC